MEILPLTPFSDPSTFLYEIDSAIKKQRSRCKAKAHPIVWSSHEVAINLKPLCTRPRSLSGKAKTSPKAFPNTRCYLIGHNGNIWDLKRYSEDGGGHRDTLYRSIDAIYSKSM